MKPRSLYDNGQCKSLHPGYLRSEPIAAYITPNTALINSTSIINTIIAVHPLSRRVCRNALFTRHVLCMSIANIITAKIIAPEIVNMAISSLIMLVPFLSVSPSWFIHVEGEGDPKSAEGVRVSCRTALHRGTSLPFCMTSTKHFLGHSRSRSNA